MPFGDSRAGVAIVSEVDANGEVDAFALALCGVSAATMLKYVIVFPLGTALFSMNLMVSVPVGISG